MELAVVIGNVTSTIHHPAYKGCKLLLLRNISPLCEEETNTTVAVDSVDAGIGDIVMVSREGKTASDILGINQAPVRSIIVGVVDTVNMNVEL